MPFCQRLPLFLFNLSLVLKVRLQARQDFAEILTSIAFDLVNPHPYIFETPFIIDGIGEDDSSYSFEIGNSDIFEFFLAGCVPDLKFDVGVIKFDSFGVWSRRR